MCRFERGAAVAVLCLAEMVARAAAAPGPEAVTASGIVVDGGGQPVAGARVVVRDAQGSVLGEAASDLQGLFTLPGLPQGQYSLSADAGALEKRDSVLVVGLRPEMVRIVLDIAPVRTSLTVTANRGIVEDETTTNAVVAVRQNQELAGGNPPTIGNVLAASPGILVQETTRGQVSPYLRGLTGYQTLLLLDGIRFNTSTFRSGPNQYLAYIQPDEAETVEAILGPTGATYGSDSLGGTINVITPQPRFSTSRRWEAHGDVNVVGATADRSGGGNAQVSLGNARFSTLLGGSLRRFNNLRTGAGEDSRNAFGRYLGLSPTQVGDMLGDRLISTGFTEYGSNAKVAWRPGATQSLTLWYAHSALDGVRSYRDQLGGVGRVLSRSTPQGLDFAYARYEKLHVGFLDSLSGTFSYNGQKDGSIRGGVRFTDAVTSDRSKVNALGYAGQGAAHMGAHHVLVFGGEIYNEQVLATRFNFNPVSLTTTQDRAQYPNDSRYRTTGLFAQNASQLAGGKVRAVLGARFTNIHFRSYADRNRDGAGRLLGVADSSRAFRDVTYHGSLAWQATGIWGFHVLASRGFRAPNLNDLGSIGATTLGYDMPVEELLRFGPLMGVDSSEGSASSGNRMRGLGPESLYNFELGTSVRTTRLYARTQVFDFELLDPISSRTVLFPTDAVPAEIAGVAVRALPQTATEAAQGVSAIATNLTPRAVKASVNDGHTRYYGLEAIARYEASSRWSLEGNYSFLVGRDLNPNRPVRRLPPQQGLARVRYLVPRRRIWLDLACRFAGAQSRLAGGDLDDDRMGASRSRNDIAAFFGGGMAAAFLSPGPNAVFRPTGETLLAIQNRVLPLGATINGVKVANNSTRVPLYLRTDGWWSLDLRGGVPIGERASLRLGISNPADTNYRVHGSGIDAPGRDVFVGFGYRF